MLRKILIAITLTGGFLLLSRPVRADISLLTFPEGSSGEVQFEKDGLFGGDATFTYSTTTKTMTVYRVDGTSAVISGRFRLSYLNCSANTNGGTLTTDSSGNVTCSDDDSSAGSGTPGGSNTSVQVNENGAHAGYSTLTYNSTTQLLVVGSSITIGGVRVGAESGIARLYISSSAFISGEVIIGGTAGGSNAGTVTLQDSSGNSAHTLSTISNAVGFNQDNGSRDFQVGSSGSDTTLLVDGPTNSVSVGPIVRTSNTFNVDGHFGVYGSSSARFYDADSSHYVGLKSPSSVSSNVTFNLPSSDGSLGDVLVTDGAGSWVFSTPNSAISNLAVEEGDVLVSSPTATIDFNATDFDLDVDFNGITGISTTTIALSTTSTKYIQNSSTTAGQVFNVASGTIVGTLTLGGDAICSNCITLGSETSGIYVSSLTAGLAIDVGSSGEAAAPSIDFDPTELTGNRTWGDASDSSIIWTWNIASGDPAFTFSNSNVATTSMTVTHLNATTTNINSVPLRWPSTQGSANRFLENNGNGSITWQQVHLSSDVSGVLPVANGGTGLSSVSDSSVLIASGTVWIATGIPNCDSTGKLLYSTTTKTFTCGTDSAGGGDNFGNHIATKTATFSYGISAGTATFNDETDFYGTSGSEFIQFHVTNSASTGNNVYIPFLLKDDSGAEDYFADMSIGSPSIGNGSESGRISFGVVSNGTIENKLAISGSASGAFVAFQNQTELRFYPGTGISGSYTGIRGAASPSGIYHIVLPEDGSAITAGQSLQVQSVDTSGDPIAYMEWASPVSDISNYQRPLLVWVSTGRIDLSTNTSTANTTSINFRDGEFRSVTEDLASSQLYRSFKTGQTANWTSGTVQGGLHIGTGTANTWYALYAVKVTSAAISTNFVVVGSTSEPVHENFSTLNTAFGTNGWRYLGMIRIGDNNVVPAGILAFEQASDGFTRFTNSVAGNTSFNMQGILSTTTVSGSSITYTVTRGMTAFALPRIVDRTFYMAGRATGATGIRLVASDGSRRFVDIQSVTGAQLQTAETASSDGIAIIWTTAASGDVTLAGFHDLVIGGGQSPPF